MPRSARRLVLCASILSILGAANSCVTPTIPLPPPEPEKVSFELDAAAGTATFSYAVDPDYAEAVVYVFNASRGRGVITTADHEGRVGPTDPFPAAAGDRIEIVFEKDDQRAGLCVLLRQGPSDPSQRCD